MLLLLICYLEANERMNEMKSIEVSEKCYGLTCIITCEKGIYILTSLKSQPGDQDILDYEKKVFLKGEKK